MKQDFFSRMGRFIKNYYRHPLYILAYGYYLFQPKFTAGVNFYDKKEFTDEIKKGKSFVRLNDGEVHFMHGGIHNCYGTINVRPLEKSLRRIAREYSKDSPYIIGLAKRYINQTNEELKNDPEKGDHSLYAWMPMKVMYKIHFPHNVKYADAHSFYIDGFFRETVEDYLMDKHLVVVTSKENIEAIKNTKGVPFKKMSFVSTPKFNSYSEYDTICKDIEKTLASIPQEDTPVLIVSTGPASKPIVYEFSKRGIQSIDTGRGLEFIYSGESLEWAM